MKHPHDDKNWWTTYLQYVASDNKTEVTEVHIYYAETLVDRKLYFGMRPVDGLLMGRAHVLAWFAREFLAGLDVPEKTNPDGDVQPPLPGINNALNT